MNYLPLIMLGVMLNAAAQLFLKEGMRRIGHFEFVWANIVPIGFMVAGNLFVLAGLVCYVVSVCVRWSINDHWLHSFSVHQQLAGFSPAE